MNNINLRPSWQGNRSGIKAGKEITNTNSAEKNNDDTINYSINLEIPYYNENVEYLQSNININKKDQYENLHNVIDKIAYISRYLLKAKDYDRLYISKNANKYFTTNN